ncbi:MAG: carbohydrate ABC transporter permease [Treponema sp.]|uniref:carbohydrate ABC transporter permease n=1 Tax=Treponema sp. TaxID=166 RepID=UPI003FA21B98
MSTQNLTGATVIDRSLIKKTAVASSCFMGLGQILYLKQYLRGACFALVELAVLFLIFFDRTTARLNGQGPIVRSIIGLITLGDEKPNVPIKMKDHSIFMMIGGLITVLLLVIFIGVYIANVITAKKAAAQIVEKQRFPSVEEARKKFVETAFPYLGLSPAILLILFFTVLPLIFSALVAFTNYSSPKHIPPNNLVDWVGLENFVTMFSSKMANSWFSAFGRVALWTIVWAFFATFSCYFTGMIFAVILVDKRIQFPKFFRTVFILPYAIPVMLSLFIWANLLNGTFGPINRTLMQFGLLSEPIKWLSDPFIAKVSMLLVNIWIGFPYSMILITSNMTAIPADIYEAATIDGANRMQQFFRITLPLVLFQTMPILIMQFAGNINNFGAVYFLTAGGPGLDDSIRTKAGATDLLISWIYKLTYETPTLYNLASVLSILVFVVLVPFAVYNFTHTKAFKEGAV